MKYWLSHLPLEVWVDVFRYPIYSWTTRKELGEIVDQIGNRKFAEFLQFYLHDWGKRMLGRMWICQVCFILCNIKNSLIKSNFLRMDYTQVLVMNHIFPTLVIRWRQCRTTSSFSRKSQSGLFLFQY